MWAASFDVARCMVDIEAGTVELCIPNYRPINSAGYRRLNLQVFNRGDALPNGQLSKGAGSCVCCKP